MLVKLFFMYFIQNFEHCELSNNLHLPYEGSSIHQAQLLHSCTITNDKMPFYSVLYCIDTL